jgi:hypothetical protein
MSLVEINYPLEILLLSGFYVLNDSFIKKRNLINIKKIQFLTRIIMQKTLFINQVKSLWNANDLAVIKLIQSNADNIYDLVTHENMKNICIKINKLNDMQFDNILQELHYKCNFTKNNGDLCQFQTFNGFHQCKRHIRKKYNRENEIIKSINLPKPILYIIIAYDLPSY